MSAIEPTSNTDDPTDNEEAKQLEATKRDKSIKSKEYQSTEEERIAHGKYLKIHKDRCEAIKVKQQERIRTE